MLPKGAGLPVLGIPEALMGGGSSAPNDRLGCRLVGVEGGNPPDRVHTTLTIFPAEAQQSLLILSCLVVYQPYQLNKIIFKAAVKASGRSMGIKCPQLSR